MAPYHFRYADCVDCDNAADLDGADIGLSTPSEPLPLCRGCGKLRCAEKAEEEIARYRQALASGYARAARFALEEAGAWLETAGGPELQQPRRTATAL